MDIENKFLFYASCFMPHIMQFNIITIFPRMFDSYFGEGMLKRAQKNDIIRINIHNLRDWTNDKHKTVDDTPYGGGAGMVMKVEPIYKALCAIKQKSKKAKKQKIILLSAKGKRWNQAMAKKYSKLDEIIMICGRYEGVDERVKNFVDEEISIGDYVLTGGEIPAMIIVDSVSRLLPGVLGNKESAISESHSSPGLLEYPQYTRPEIFQITPPLFKRPACPASRGEGDLRAGEKNKTLRVPKILLSGDHKKIDDWRRKKMKKVK